MADTGFKTAGAVVSAGTWTGFTTANINTSDNTYATVANLSFQAATINNLAFGIPSGSTINGIEAQAEFSASSAGRTASIRLSLSHNNGTNYTTTKTDTNTTTTDATRTYGGAADTWGRSWTDTEFADGTFVVKIEGNISSGGASCRLDYFAIKVYYTTSSTRAGRLSLLGVG